MITRALLAAALAAPVAGQVTERASAGPFGTPPLGYSEEPSISLDGSCVAFRSWADYLVPGDTNGDPDVFVFDWQSGTTERVSVDSNGVEGNDNSWWPSISGDGRYVTFQSDASNLISGDTNQRGDVFVRDRQNGTTERVSLTWHGIQSSFFGSSRPSISFDGRYVAFESAASLVQGDSNSATDIFVRDRQNATTECVSLSSSGSQGNSSCEDAHITSDGRYVVFTSYASNLVSGDTNNRADVFLRDRQNGTTERVSLGSSGQGNGSSGIPSVSDDGRYVAFHSDSTDLVGIDWNGFVDVFVRDRQSGTTEFVSLGPGGAQANGNSYPASISGDGRTVAFASLASNLVPGDTGVRDVFVRDRTLVVPRSVGIRCSTPYLAWSGRPTLGWNYHVRTVDLGLASQVLLVDWSNSGVPAFPRTVRLPCPVYLIPDSTIALGNQPSYTFAIPSDNALIGVHLKTQATILSSPVVTTQVIDALIGE